MVSNKKCTNVLASKIRSKQLYAPIPIILRAIGRHGHPADPYWVFWVCFISIGRHRGLADPRLSLVCFMGSAINRDLLEYHSCVAHKRVGHGAFVVRARSVFNKPCCGKARALRKAHRRQHCPGGTAGKIAVGTF